MSDTFERKVVTPAEREARKLFKDADAAKAMTAHERAQKAFQKNRERSPRPAVRREQRRDRQAKRHRKHVASG